MNNKFIASSISLSLTFSPLIATAAPTGGQVTSGNASIQQNGQITDINQSSQNASINWDTFNIGSNETVNFIQPNKNSITVNNIHDANPSTIMGNLNANGRVFLSNPNGMIFTSGSQVNVGGLLATSSNIELQADGSLLFSNPAAGSIINQGEIISADTGYIAFFAPDIQNEGTLQANNGDVVLSTANSGTLFLPDSAGIGFNLESLDSIDPLGIDNGGEIIAAGGRVLLSSDAIDSTLHNAINNDGLISVSAIQNDGGQIRLLSSQGSIDQTGTLSASAIEHGDGGEVIIIAEKNLNAAGSIDARGGNQSGNGGFVETSGLEHIRINTFVDTRAENGETGHWLIDPADLTINTDPTDYNINDPDNITSGSTLNISDLKTALQSSNITLLASNSITLDSELSSVSGNNSLTFQSGTVNINAAINLDGSVIFTSANVNLGADITSGGKIEFASGSLIQVTGTRTLTTNGDSVFDMRNAVVSGSAGATDHLILASESGNVFLIDLNVQDSLENFTINRTGTSGSFNIDGEIYAQNFTYTSTSDQAIGLTSDLIIQAAGNVSITGSSITGGNTHNLDISAANITLYNASSLASLTLTSDAAGTTTLNGNLDADGGDIRISGGDIELGAHVDITARSTAGVYLGDISNSTSHDLNISVFDGALELSDVSDINSLSISNGATQTVFNGNIDIHGDFAITDTQSVSFSSAQSSITANTINTSSTVMESTGAINLNTTAANTAAEHGAHIGGIDAESISIDTTDLYLYDDITTTAAIDLTANDNIFVAGDTVITGALNLGASGNTVDINSVSGESHDLSIVLGDQDFILGNVGNVNALSSFSLTGNGALTLEGSNKIPQTNGTGGVSFLGNLTLGSLESFTIDTSANNGAINLSGLSLDKAAILLDAGSGDISLGTFGSGEAIASLGVTTTGTINLHGNINLPEGTFDFSKASAIVLQDDITFGSETVALKDLNFGEATLDGNYDLTVYSAKFSVGEVGQDIALQNMTLNMGEANLAINNDLNIAGDLTINANTISLDALVSTSGGDITLDSLAGITMTASAEMTATDGNINATAATGDIALSRTTALNQANITATAGSITNSAGDYQSSDNTSINIVAADINLISGVNSGQSESSPLVLDAGNSGSININAGGSIFIANLSNSDITTNQDFIDNSALAGLATNDALNQIKQPDIDSLAFQHLDVVDPQWQQNSEEDEGSVRSDQTISAPRIYYSKKGWRLGNPD